MTTSEILPVEKSIVTIRVIDSDLPAEISVPANARGLIVLAACPGVRAAGSLCRRATEIFNDEGFATVSANLDLHNEPGDDFHVWQECDDPDLLEERLVCVTEWIGRQPNLSILPIGYFGAGAGSESVVMAAARRPEIGAVVIYSGKPERAAPILNRVSAPCLFIFGAENTGLLERRHELIGKLPEGTARKVEVIGWTPDPLHERHAKERIVFLASNWYERYLTQGVRLPARQKGAL